MCPHESPVERESAACQCQDETPSHDQVKNFSGLGRLCEQVMRIPPILLERRENDVDGKGLLVMARFGIKTDPPPLVKARLQKEFGLYPTCGIEPFGEENFWGPCSQPSANVTG